LELFQGRGQEAKKWDVSGLQKHWNDILATFPAGKEPRGPIALYVYMMDTLLGPSGESREKHSIQQNFKALRAAGFVNIDTRMTVSAKERFTLPVGKEKLCDNHEDKCCQVMTRLSSAFKTLGEHNCAERWLRAAWWGESLRSPCFLFPDLLSSS
jgi:hypothetical protein